MTFNRPRGGYLMGTPNLLSSGRENAGGVALVDVSSAFVSSLRFGFPRKEAN